MSLFSELRRRRVFRTLGIYILAAWGLMQVADVLLPALSLPEASIRYLLLASVAGFPVALVFAWLYDIGADGIRRTPGREALEGTEDDGEGQLLGKGDYLILAGLLGILATITLGVVRNADDLLELPPISASSETELPMIAVLPFAQLGGGEDGEFFALGVHDDLLISLSKIKNLRVVSRTSVMEYAKTTKQIPEIGKELGASVILEGGVRIAGGQIRMNTQLIDASTDAQLWAETFDRALTAENIFAVQTEVTRAITSALRLTLSPKEESDLKKQPTRNLAAYRAFHNAMQFARSYNPGFANYRENYEKKLEDAIALDSQYTRPIMELVGSLAQRNQREQNETDIARIEELIARIQTLDPGSSEAITAEAYYFYYVLRDFDRADELIARAQSLNPSDTRLLEIQSWIKRRKGDWEGFVETARRATLLEPNDLSHKATLVRRLMVVHDYAEAQAVVLAAGQANLEIAIFRNQLELSRHHDLETYQEGLAQFMTQASPARQRSLFLQHWLIQLSLGDIEGASQSLATAEDLIFGGGSVDKADQLHYAMLALEQHLLTGDMSALEKQVEAMKNTFGVESLVADDHDYALIYGRRLHATEKAFLALAEGNRQQAKQITDQHILASAGNHVELFFTRELICRNLGLLADAEGAVRCLREGFDQPSDVHPFLEPRLPHYARIRDSAAFKQLKTELIAQGWLDG
ncbi:adenylate/guanylate cyclase [Congregibacter litoralis]|uniref:Putative integral membrane protein n=1 Tax=Congregibacter litoralis KT71 TaxID=314285 RepID=A4ABU0_9GAMM|nr:adenylate/guanylate cyclase [Congregibacter litoralis]EAQ96603.1 putative integral membrane protein [Congregibacter litoralis KT71]